VSDLHTLLGWVVIAVNALAGALGAWRWYRAQPARAFWALLRAGQLLVMLEAVGGAVLLLQGEALPRLHLIYGLVPLAVAFVAEQLRLASADIVLGQRDLEGTADVARLPEEEQRALVAEIVRRETGVMAASAIVVALLAMRAQGLVL
jgi:hypothetical protein